MPRPVPGEHLGPQPALREHDPEPQVTHALLTRLRRLVEFDVPMDELRKSADAYILEVDQAIAGPS